MNTSCPDALRSSSWRKAQLETLSNVNTGCSTIAMTAIQNGTQVSSLSYVDPNGTSDDGPCGNNGDGPCPPPRIRRCLLQGVNCAPGDTTCMGQWGPPTPGNPGGRPGGGGSPNNAQQKTQQCVSDFYNSTAGMSCSSAARFLYSLYGSWLGKQSERMGHRDPWKTGGLLGSG